MENKAGRQYGFETPLNRLTNVEDDTPSTADTVADQRTAQGSDKRSRGQDRSDQRVGARWEEVATVRSLFTVDLDEVGHLFASGDVATVIRTATACTRVTYVSYPGKSACFRVVCALD